LKEGIAVISNIIDLILHADKYIPVLIQGYGGWVYLILFLILFCETGLVVTPFLPGDSLLFASGAIAALGSVDIKTIFVIFILAAVIGDTVNYTIGHTVGTKISSRLFKKEHVDRAERFYKRYGTVTIIIARFMPIIRTFAPFVAGIGKMKCVKFMFYNLIGGILWVTLFVFTGYKFGSIPFVKNNFSTVTYAIIFISLLPATINFLNSKRFKVYLSRRYEKIYTLLVKCKKEFNKGAIFLYSWGVLTLISIVTFGELVEDAVLRNNWKYDVVAINYVNGVRNSSLNSIFKIITSTGNAAFVIAITLVVVLLLIIKEKKKDAIFFASSVLGVWLFNAVLKLIFKRDRPGAAWLVDAWGYSFPSGHAMTFMGLSILLIYYVLIIAKNKKAAVMLAVLILVYSIFVGLSRVYVGVHYLSDVLAGWAAAFIWISAVMALYRRVLIKTS
jgi:membrane-associated protein